jgi:CysZ protein
MFASVRQALTTLFDRDFRRLVFWTLAATAVVFVLAFIGLEYGIAALPPTIPGWAKAVLALLAPVVLIVAVVALGAPVAAMVGSLFLERIAAKVDARFYPNDPKGRGAPLGVSARESFKLIGLSILISVAAIPFDILPPIPEIIALLANGWLLGREFFELAALRHLSAADSDALRRRHAGKIYGGGLLIALLSVVPGIDLIAPFFGAALMAHLFKRVTHQEARS